MSRIRPSATVACRIAALAAVPALLVGVAPRPVLGQPLARRHPLLRVNQPAAPTTGLPTAVTGSDFRMSASHHYGSPTNASGYSVIVVTGPQQAWAFGGTNPGGPSAPVATEWNGTTATSATLPSGLTSFISDAEATASTDIWAASEYGRYLLHFDGTQWRVAKRWPHGEITGLTAIDPTDVWVFGTSSNGASDLGTWYYDGFSWQRVYGPGGSIYRASAISSNDIWAIAASPTSYSVLRFNGESWQPVPVGTALDGVQPADILAYSDTDVWILGDTPTTSGGVRLVLLHWNGVRWVSLVTYINAWAGRLAAGADRSVLATATPTSASAEGLVLGATAGPAGRPVVTLRSWLDSGGVSDVAVAGRSQLLWGSGAVLNRTGGNAVIWTGELPQSASGLGA